MYISFGLKKFLAPLPGTKKFLCSSTRRLAYTDHIIQFGLNKFLAPLAGDRNDKDDCVFYLVLILLEVLFLVVVNLSGQ